MKGLLRKKTPVGPDEPSLSEFAKNLAVLELETDLKSGMWQIHVASIFLRPLTHRISCWLPGEEQIQYGCQSQVHQGKAKTKQNTSSSLQSYC